MPIPRWIAARFIDLLMYSAQPVGPSGAVLAEQLVAIAEHQDAIFDAFRDEAWRRRQPLGEIELIDPR